MHVFSLLGFWASSQRAASTEQRTSRLIVPCVPHRAEHCNGHREQRRSDAEGRAGGKGEGGSSAPRAFLLLHQGTGDALPQGGKRCVRLYLCCLFTRAARAPVLEALMPGLLSKDTGPVPSGLWKVSQRDFCWF